MTNMTKKVIMKQSKKITLDALRGEVLGELSSIESRLTPRTFKALQNKVMKSKQRGLTTLSKDFRVIFDTDIDTKKFSVKDLKQEIKDIKAEKSEQTQIKEKIDAKFVDFMQGESITFDGGVNPKELKYVLDKLKNVNERVILEVEGKRWYTLDVLKLKQMSKYVDSFYDPEDFSDAENYGSDAEAIARRMASGITINLIRVVKSDLSKNNGGFFKYYNNTSVDLEEFGIYKKAPESYSENCLIQSFIAAGLDPKITSRIRSMVIPSNADEASFKYVPTNKLRKICEEFNLYITVKKPVESGEDRHVNHYPKKYKKCPEGHTQIDLGLIDNHYFFIKEIPINQYALENYFELCDKKGFETIRLANGRKQKQFTTSFRAIKFMHEHQEKFLTLIPFEDLLNTQYHDQAKTITSLSYDEGCVKINERTKKSTDKDVVNVFFDFETITTGKHVPYMCSIDDVGTVKTFTGEKCGKAMLDYLFNKYYFDNPKITIKLIAHNASYDFAFIQKHLVFRNIIQKGSRVMNATGQYWGRRGCGLNVTVQDSYSIITMPLSNFPKSFGLEGKKEVIPYKLYTRENVDKQFLSVDELKPYCIQQVKESNIGVITTEKDYTLFQNEMIANARGWNCLSRNEAEIDIIKYSRMYCERDVELLKKGYNIFGGYIEELDCNIDNYISAAQFANDYMLKEGVFDGVYKVSSTPREFIMRSMVGGRVMCCENKQQDITGHIYDFDAVSLYPSAMKRLGGYLKGVPRVIEEDQKNMAFLGSCDGYFVKIKINKVGIRRKFPCISYINKEGIRTWTNDPEECVHVGKTGLEDLIEFQQIEFDIIEGYYYQDGRNNTIGEVIGNLFEKRKEQKKKKNKVEQVYKLIMNSAYGKTLLKAFDKEIKFVQEDKLADFVDKNYNMIKYYESVETDSEDYKRFKMVMDKSINNHYNNAHAGCEVLEMSKRIMNEVMCLAEDLGLDIYYQDTDSMHIKSKAIALLKEKYKEKYNRDLVGEDMGQFHTDFSSDKITSEIHARRHIALGKKCYIDELVGKDNDGNEVVDYHIRMKGVPNKSILHKAMTEERDVMDIFKSMLKGKKEVFDLNCGGYKINFKHNGDYSISTNTDRYERALRF